MTGADRRRLFVAVTLPSPVTAALDGAVAPLRGRFPGLRWVPPDRWHLTLAFLGQRPASELPALLAILQQLPAHPIDLLLDHASHFAQLALAWAALAQPSPALLALRAACMHALAQQGLAPRFELDRFTPHVTLARQAPPPASQDFAPIAWQADELVLVESLKSSGDYRILASRKLI